MSISWSWFSTKSWPAPAQHHEHQLARLGKCGASDAHDVGLVGAAPQPADAHDAGHVVAFGKRPASNAHDAGLVGAAAHKKKAS